MYVISCTALVLVAGGRSSYVGTDAGYYARMFSNTNSFNDVINTKLEPGYFILCWIAHAFSDNYISIFTIVASVAIICLAWGIRKYSVNQAVSFFIVLVGGYYTFFFNGVRQGLASAVYFLAIGSIYRKNVYLYTVCVVVAMFFHKSAIIALPAYFLITRKNNFRLNLFIVAFGVVFAFLFDFFIDLGEVIDPRYHQYGMVIKEGGGFVSLTFTVALCLGFVFFKTKIIRYREMYDPLLNMFLLATIIIIVSTLRETSASGIRRLAMYFSMSSILLWPIVYENIRGRRIKTLFLFCFASGYFLYYALTLQAFGNLVPYMVNPVVSGW